MADLGFEFSQIQGLGTGFDEENDNVIHYQVKGTPQPILQEENVSSKEPKLHVYRDSQKSSPPLLSHFVNVPPNEISDSLKRTPLAETDDDDLQDINDDALLAAMEACDENTPQELMEEDELFFDDSLSPLEKIFLFAKSDLPVHRVFIAKELPDLIQKLDVAEAVEYIIPLINTIATDPEERVREVFAPGVEKIIWFYYTHCRLMSEDTNIREHSFLTGHDLSIGHENETLIRGPVSDIESSSLPPSTPPSKSVSPLGYQPEDTITPNGLDNEFYHETSLPTIGISTFTPLLHALLLDSNDSVATSAQFAVEEIIRHLTRPIPKAMDLDREHESSTELLENEILKGAILGIGSLQIGNSSDNDGEFSNQYELEYSHQSSIGSPRIQDTESQLSPESHSEELSSLGKAIMLNLITSVANLISPEKVSALFLPRLLELKDGDNYVIRRAVVQSLGAVAKCLPAQIVRNELLPIYDVLCEDSIWHVRRACCAVIPLVYSNLPFDERRIRIVKVIDRFTSDISRSVQSAVGEVIGEIIYMFKDDPLGVPHRILDHYIALAGMPSQVRQAAHQRVIATNSPFGSQGSEEDLSWGSPIYPLNGSDLDGQGLTPFVDNVDSVNISDPERPVLCAFNFPAVVLTLGREKWDVHLKDLFKHLSKHPDERIRRSLAASLHEIAKIIGPELTKRDLEQVFSSYLEEQNNDVRSPLFSHFADFIEALPRAEESEDFVSLDMEDRPTSPTPSFFSSSSASSSASTAATITRVSITQTQKHLQRFFDIWKSLDSEWRYRCDLASQIGKLALVLGPSFAGKEMLTLAGAGIQDPVTAVRDTAVRGFATLIKVARQDAVAIAVVRGQLKRLATGLEYRSRVIFAQIALATLTQAQDLYENFDDLRRDFETDFIPLLNILGSDKVINVRIAVARVVKRMCEGEINALFPVHSRTPILSDLIYRIARDTDADVRNFVAEIFYTLSPTHRQGHFGSSREVSDNSGTSTRQSSEDDSLHGDGPIITSTLKQRQDGKDKPSSLDDDIDTEDGVDNKPLAPALIMPKLPCFKQGFQ